MRYWAFGLVASLASLAGPWLFAEDLRLELQGGPQLTVKAVAEQQQWITHGDKIWVAAVRGGKLVVKEISLGSPPEPGPGPEPGPRPEPQPGPGPKTVIWIEESGQRTPQQAAAIIDKNVRAAIDAARWTLRVTDVDVVDESGRPPADLAPYLERARHAGLPWMVILEDGREVYTGKAPPDLPSLVILLRRYGLPIGGAVKEDGPAGAAASPAREAPPKAESPQPTADNCPTGQCPTQVPTRRWRIFR
jgi:hypothetical protein